MITKIYDLPYTTLFRSQNVSRANNNDVGTADRSDSIDRTPPAAKFKTKGRFVPGKCWPNSFRWAKATLSNHYRQAVMIAQDRKSTRLNSSHEWISYAVF